MENRQEFWPDGIQGAVSLTFDDGHETHIQNAIPTLDRHGLKGTFYINPGRGANWESLLPEWKKASVDGHEMGNHTCDHPCSCNFRFHDDYCLEKLSLDDIADTIDRATTAMDEAFPEQNGKRSYCYPCYQSHVGSGSNRQSYVPLVAQRFKVGRGGGERANNPDLIDLSYVWSWAVEDVSGQKLVDYVEKAVEQGQWAIICMHGIGGGHLAISTEALAEACDHLARHRDRIWTDTAIGATDYIIDRRSELRIQAP